MFESGSMSLDTLARVALARQAARPQCSHIPLWLLLQKPRANTLRWTQPGLSGGIPRGSLRKAAHEFALLQVASPTTLPALYPQPWRDISGLEIHWNHGMRAGSPQEIDIGAVLDNLPASDL